MKFFNSINRQKEKFKPIKDNLVRIYSCGPTVYNYAHIGNLRSFIFADILQRSLKFNNYQVKWVMNITDVDDKTIRDSKKQYPELKPMIALKKFTQFYEKAFWQDLEKLNVEKPDFTPRATETIDEIQKIIYQIFQNGFAYEKDRSVYFDLKKYIKKYKYGWLVKLDFSKMKVGQRIDKDEYNKENFEDFALWKGKKLGEPSWDFDFQGKILPGRPGWHIECSAMSHKYLGFPFDIHTGGIDLKFPHHENEIAQNTASFKIEKSVNFFLHNEYVLVKEKKMSKSLNNFYTLRDLEKNGFSPLDYRYLCLGSHYQNKMNFTWQALKSAKNSLDELKNFIQRWSNKDKKTITIRQNKYQELFLKAIRDNLNTPEALAVVWKMIRDQKINNQQKVKLLFKFDTVLGLGLRNIQKEKIPKKIIKLLKIRKEYRKSKNWAEADKIRKEIEKNGYLLEDTKRGDRLIKKEN